MSEENENNDDATAAAINPQNIINKAITGCTKNDRYKTKLCECPECVAERSNAPIQPVIVTDEMILHNVQIDGPIFLCPKCKASFIPYTHNLCGGCGVPVIIQSEILTQKINKLQQGNG